MVKEGVQPAAAALVTSSTRERTEPDPSLAASFCGHTVSLWRNWRTIKKRQLPWPKAWQATRWPGHKKSSRTLSSHTTNGSTVCLPLPPSFSPPSPLFISFSFTLSSLAPTQWNFNSQVFLLTAFLAATATSSTPLHSRRIRNILIKTYFLFHFSRDFYLWISFPLCLSFCFLIFSAEAQNVN